MARIAGINLPNKRIEIALTYVHGIGRARANKILDKVGIGKDTKSNDLSAAEVNSLREEIEKNYRIEGELRRDIQANVKRLKEINSYRGYRHARGLPSRGQRTKTNSRTVRGNVRRTMGSGRTKLTKT
ncbi:30S ribosomal protein S13 [Candidatus Uhrbacteria bacterium]|nr:30S ribosomal protein S13 [Candidatus Uhrbacteria bacterium]